MTTDSDLEELRSAYERLRAENTRLREEERLRAAIALAWELCNDERLSDQADVELVRAVLRGKWS